MGRGKFVQTGVWWWGVCEQTGRRRGEREGERERGRMGRWGRRRGRGL